MRRLPNSPCWNLLTAAKPSPLPRPAYEISETFDTPVIIKMCTRVAHSQSVVETGEREERPTKPYEKNIQKNVMMPANAKKRHYDVEKRMKALEEYAETTPLNRIEWGGKELGIITSSTSYQYTKEVFGDSVSVLKLGMVHPLPEKLIKKFASQVKSLAVIEELDPVIENYCKQLGLTVIGKDILPLEDEYSQNLIAAAFGRPFLRAKSLKTPCLPARPSCARAARTGGCSISFLSTSSPCSATSAATRWAQRLPSMRSTFPPAMGASLSGIHGFNKALGKESENKTVAVIGDSTFMHSGMTGLANIAYNQSVSTVIILDNSITGHDGSSAEPHHGLQHQGRPCGQDRSGSALPRDGLSARARRRPLRPCGNRKRCSSMSFRQKKRPSSSAAAPARFEIRQACPAPSCGADKCRSCKACMKLGCPAISMREGKCVIDSTQCVGCGVCEELCKFSAIVK